MSWEAHKHKEKVAYLHPSKTEIFILTTPLVLQTAQGAEAVNGQNQKAKSIVILL